MFAQTLMPWGACAIIYKHHTNQRTLAHTHTHPRTHRKRTQMFYGLQFVEYVSRCANAFDPRALVLLDNITFCLIVSRSVCYYSCCMLSVGLPCRHNHSLSGCWCAANCVCLASYHIYRTSLNGFYVIRASRWEVLGQRMRARRTYSVRLLGCVRNLAP